jgi:hypothetical protein
MTREEAANLLDHYCYGNTNILRECDDDIAEKIQTAMDEAIAALRGPQPDPITGLVPCGCGGKAVIHDHQNYGEPGMNYWVGCDNQKCDCTVGMYLDETGRFEKKEDAIKAWNTAMGYKGGAE